MVSPPTLRRIASALLFVASVVSFASFFVTWYTAEVGKNRLLMSPMFDVSDVFDVGSEPFNVGAVVWRLAVMVSTLTGLAAGFLTLGLCAGPLDFNVTLYSIKACLASAGLAILMVLMTSGVIDSGTFEVGFFLCIGVVFLASVALTLLCWDTWSQDSPIMLGKSRGYMPVPQDANLGWGVNEPVMERYAEAMHAGVNEPRLLGHEPCMQEKPYGVWYPDHRAPNSEFPGRSPRHVHDLRCPIYQEDYPPPSPPRPPALDFRQLQPPFAVTTPPFTDFREQDIQFIQGPPPNALLTPKLLPLPPVVLPKLPMIPTLSAQDYQLAREHALQDIAWCRQQVYY